MNQQLSTKYHAVHKWAHKHITTVVCVQCGNTGRLERANISGNYLRELTDWKVLCVPCHRKFDDVNRKMSETIQKLRTACIKGHGYKEYGFKVYHTKKGTVIRRCKQYEDFARQGHI